MITKGRFTMTTITYRTPEGVTGEWSIDGELPEDAARAYLAHHHPQYEFLGSKNSATSRAHVVTKDVVDAGPVEASEGGDRWPE